MNAAPPPFDALWFRLAAGLVTGLVLGSFVTMLSYRLPRRISIVAPRSRCPACGTTLTPLELVPVASWAFQRGRCRTCASFIGWRYPLIELVTALGVTAVFVVTGFTFMLVLPIMLIVAFITFLVIRLERETKRS